MSLPTCYGITWSKQMDGGQDFADKVINIILYTQLSPIICCYRSGINWRRLLAKNLLNIEPSST